MCQHAARPKPIALLSPAKSIMTKERSASTRTSNEATEVVDGLVISKLRNLADALLIIRMYCNVAILQY
jgi:hypothetical protein